MKTQTAVAFFGGRRQLAQALNISVQAVAYWVKRGAVPRGQAYRLQVMTKQQLMVDVTQYKA
jgi:DNA-binding transcriptional regulator YiaG